MHSTTRVTNGAVALLAALAVTAILLVGPAGSEAAAPKLTATVGPGFTISLKTPAGKKVTTVKPGTYAITVTDKSANHDFRLKGPGVNRVLSSVSAVGKKTVTVRLSAGKYLFTCQPHAAAMRGAFTVR